MCCWQQVDRIKKTTLYDFLLSLYLLLNWFQYCCCCCCYKGNSLILLFIQFCWCCCLFIQKIYNGKLLARPIDIIIIICLRSILSFFLSFVFFSHPHFQQPFDRCWLLIFYISGNNFSFQQLFFSILVFVQKSFTACQSSCQSIVVVVVVAFIHSHLQNLNVITLWHQPSTHTQNNWNNFHWYFEKSIEIFFIIIIIKFESTKVKQHI